MIVFSGGAEFDKILLFSKLSKVFEERGEKVINFSFNIYQKKIYKLFDIESLEILKEKKIKTINFEEKELQLILQFEKEINSNFEEEMSKEHILEYLGILEIINKKEKIDVCILWNNSTLYERALYVFCKKNNIRYYILEQGYFRPITLALDKKGVNAKADIKKEKNFYKKLNINEEKYKENLFISLIAKEKKEEIKRKDKIYKLYRILDKLKMSLKKDGDITEKSLIEYFINKYKIFKNKKIKIDEKIQGDYIFIPFQVETDSQIILNSPKIKKMTELFELVSKAVEEYNLKTNKQIKAVFKTHPMDPALDIKKILYLNKKYKDSILVTIGDTKELIKNSKAVITINSTVGVEALCEYKPVITLGEAFYNIEDISYHVENFDELEKTIKIALSKELDKELIKKFLYYLRFNYFKEIYWRNPDDKSIERIVDEVLNEKRKETC